MVDSPQVHDESSPEVAPGDRLTKAFLSHRGHVSDKWEQYLAIYGAELEPFVARGQSVRLLEIGVQNGGSLQIWRSYLPPGSAIVGIDIDPGCAKLELGDGIRVLIGDATDPATLDQLLGDTVFDIVLDDGSHRSEHIIAAFESCWGRVAPGGLFIAEDLHCSYFASHGGGFRKPDAAVEYFKALADAVNADHFEADAAGKASPAELDRLRALGRQIARVTFYDSVTVVQRLAETRDAPYRRVMTGLAAPVADPSSAVPHLPVAQLRGLLLSSAAAQAFEPALRASVIAARETVDAQREAIAAQRETIEQLRADLDRVQQAAEQARREAEAAQARALRAEAEAQAITASTIWRATRPLRSAMLAVPPWARVLARRAVKGAWWTVTGQLSARLRAWRAAPPPSAFAAVAAPAPQPGDTYAAWCATQRLDAGALRLQRRRARGLARQPRFSVLVPVFRTPLDVFDAMVTSVTAQSYGNWELCLAVVDTGADAEALIRAARVAEAADPRICVAVLTENHGISGNSNRALEMVTGDWVVLLDHDDMLTPDALFELARAVNTEPEAVFIHSDKDMVDRSGTQRTMPLFKPRWSPDTMLNANYLTHISALRTDRLREIGGWDPATDGAQDWDLFLRVIGRHGRVAHVPRVLYHWRQIGTSVSTGGLDAKPYAAQGQLRALEKHLPLAGWPDAKPRFDGPHLRMVWGDAWRPALSVVVVGGAAKPSLKGAIQRLGAELVPASGASLPAAVDAAIARSRGDVVVLVDANFLPDDEAWLDEMSGPLANPDIAIVGGRVLDGAGQIVDFGVFFQDGAAWPAFRGEPEHYYGPAGGGGWYRNAIAAPGGALAFRKSLWQEVGGFGREGTTATRADLRFCLDVARRGLGRLLLNPFARFRSPAGVPSRFEANAGTVRIPASAVVAALPQGDPYVSAHLDAATASGAPRIRVPKPLVVPVHDYAAEARYVAGTYDATASDVVASAAACAKEPAGPLRRMLWVVPGFEVPFYGGIHTILRAADHFRRAHGVEAAFAVLAAEDSAAISARIARAFPELAAATPVACFQGQEIPAELGRFDAAACTLWTTAFPLLRMRDVRRKYYFVQDWEPLFYPAGTISSAVEATYRFGFHAICNTPSLAESYRMLGGRADHFMPAVDGTVFHAEGRRPRAKDEPFVLVCYARPGTPRNCFEALSEGLRLLKQRHGDRIEIISAGAGWDTAQFGLDGVVRNLGLLPYAETGALYRSADAGLVAMATRHPSYLPFELMACGAAVVTTRNPHTGWLLRDGENSLLCEMTRSDIAATVDRLVGNDELRDAIAAQGRADVEARHRDWNATLEGIHDILVQVCEA